MRLFVAGMALVAALTGCAGNGGGSAPSTDSSVRPTTGAPTVVATVAQNLEVPWGLAFLPDGTAIVTERDSRRVLAIKDGQTTTLGTIDAAAPRGEAGLLGVAVSPAFAQDRQVFLYFTTDADNRVVRTTVHDGRLGDQQVVLSGIPSGSIHDGGRMTFGPDGYLYVATGEVGDRGLAQQTDSLGGKILRITADGRPAPGNPDPRSPVWSTGHRNVQGLAFDSTGQLWASEFGANKVDELNRIEPGGNYGWPDVEGEGDRGEFTNPDLTWPVSAASPSGLAYANGYLWMASLRGERLWRIGLADGKAVQPVDFFVGDYGRLRTVAAAPDGRLWITTSNRDGRGDPRSTDDRILAVAISPPEGS